MFIKRLHKSFFTILLTSVLLSSYVFPQKETTVVHPEWSKNATIYEVNIRQYTPEGTFKAFERYLPALNKMGIKILWLMPINPIGKKNRKGSLGSYYSVQDYEAINPEFGTETDLKNLINSAHKLGMKVIIDWVADHTSWDNVLTKSHPDYYKKDSSGNFAPPAPDWTDVIALNYNNPSVWIYMEGAMEYWVKRCDVDGFRCDVAGMVPISFWNFARKELEKLKPVFMLAEAEGTEFHEHAFDMTYSWKLHNITKEVAAGKSSAGKLTDYFEDEEKNYNPDAYRMVFTSNHDENSWNGSVFQRYGKAAKTFAVFCGVVKGMPLIYSGQEAGMDKSLRFFDKDTINWKYSEFRSIYTKLVQLKLKNKAIWNGVSGGEMQFINTNNDSNIFAFYREKEGNVVIAIFNLSNKNAGAEINSENITGNFTDLFSGKRITMKNQNTFELGPWEYKIYFK
jgi:cyclomaltodextrinase / maltogenic alpha-amylase / neopullulanase